ncbi:zf-H2C2 2 domain containing protein [Asbolus verrucosus]|uniref:Zf-H2C2 2 domain containing protein n=1 Tax=Asbolus verrucosus TaxID=1661398 RepID=A0A482VDC0_ASBVE|nr:zf-H2C2 2 domain containing protein [Asbolus verrucosus]
MNAAARTPSHPRQMATMKYPNVSGGTNMAVSGNGSHVDEVDSLFTSSCWQNSNMNLQNDFIDTHSLTLDSSMSNLGADKLLLDSPISQDDNEIETDALDKLFLSSQPTNSSLAELKPLPPFTGYTANLSINGIQGHHYHTISQRIPEENNNSYNSYNEQNIVSSSTCNVSADSAGDCAKTMYGVDEVVKLGYSDCANPDSVSSAKMYEDCSHPNVADSVTHIKTEIAEYDISLDFANIIGSAIADTTVPNANAEGEDPTGSRDSWMDIDAFIGDACGEQQKNLIITQDGLSEFVIPCTNSEYTKPQQMQPQQGGSTLQTLLTHGYMPLLHNRLQNGPPIKQEAPSSTNFASELITTSSPPANVVSTTDNLLLTVNGRFMPQYAVHGLDPEHRIRSPDMLGQNYPHTTTTTPSAPKKSRSRAQKKQAQQQASSTVFQAEQNLGLLGKEKPVHRCSICNRGFLNKSNIKVHLRTHTGEKPFRCDTCAKAFRQKAHLLKHQQIHKRIGRD